MFLVVLLYASPWQSKISHSCIYCTNKSRNREYTVEHFLVLSIKDLYYIHGYDSFPFYQLECVGIEVL